MLELIFQGFLEWAYGLALECWQYFSTALLDIMSMDFAYLKSHAPVVDEIMQIPVSYTHLDVYKRQELVLTMLAEASTRDISKASKPEGFFGSMEVARQGGEEMCIRDRQSAYPVHL